MSPSGAVLRDARYVGLGRPPATDAARRLVSAVLDAITPHLDGTRALGPGKRATLRADLGCILGGVLVPAFKGRVVRAQQGRNGFRWRGAVLGGRAFWRVANAMIRAGLVGCLPGTKGGGDGLAAVLWARPALLDMAAGCGCTASGAGQDWRPGRDAPAKPPKVAPARLVTCNALRGVPAPAGGADGASLDAMRARVLVLNDALARAGVRGCPGVALQRRFRHSLAFGGRHYAPGDGGYQTMPERERLGITLDGEAVCEVDVHASQLTVFLALAGRRTLPPGDLYAGAHPNRAASKAYVVQSLGAGKLKARWARGNKTPDDARASKPGDVRAAVLVAYPELGNLAGAIRADILATLPAERRAWGVGQHLVAVEAGIVADALAACLAAGVPALPVHDALIVPRSAEGVARRALVLQPSFTWVYLCRRPPVPVGASGPLLVPAAPT